MANARKSVAYIHKTRKYQMEISEVMLRTGSERDLLVLVLMSVLGNIRWEGTGWTSKYRGFFAFMKTPSDC